MLIIGLVLFVGSSFFGFSFGQSCLLLVAYMTIVWIAESIINRRSTNHTKDIEALIQKEERDREYNERKRKEDALKKQRILQEAEDRWERLYDYLKNYKHDGFMDGGLCEESFKEDFFEYFERYYYSQETYWINIADWKDIILKYQDDKAEAELEAELAEIEAEYGDYDARLKEENDKFFRDMRHKEMLDANDMTERDYDNLDDYEKSQFDRTGERGWLTDKDRRNWRDN